MIGGGWAGYSVADALSTIQQQTSSASSPAAAAAAAAFDIEILDASPRGPGGLAGGWRTPKLNKPVESGIHGFWREYKNTFAVIEDRIGLDLDDVLTPYTPSILISQSGRVAVSPVLGTGGEKEERIL